MENSNSHFALYADKFLRSIYASPKGAIRLAVLERDLLPYIYSRASDLRILDLGSGAGQMAIWAASLGARVDVVDLSLPLLQTLKKTALEFGVLERINFHHQDIFAFVNAITEQEYDGVFCHAVAEWIAEDLELFRVFAHCLKRGGILSLAYYNFLGLEFTHNVFGNFNYLSRGLKSPKSAKMTPKYPRSSMWADALEADFSFLLQRRSGICCFYDYMKERDRAANSLTAIIVREIMLSERKEFLPVARYIHDLCLKI